MSCFRKICWSLIIANLSVVAFASALEGKAPFSRDWVPEPIFEEEPGFVELYWTAWEQAYDHVAIQEGIPQSPYMDEAFAASHIWIWDTCFMVLFCKYAPDRFPGVETLNNFYEAFHSDQYRAGDFPLGIQHPDNPPLFAWAEYGNYLFTGDDDHARTLLTQTQYLQKHFDWFESMEKGWRYKYQGGESAEVTKATKALGYEWSGCSSGMDNTPRRHDALWVDAIAQQGLSALVISRMAERIGETELAAQWKTRYEALKKTVNTYYWDSEDGIYYDISQDGSQFYKVKTPASYWPMLAEMCSPSQARAMARHIRNPETFGGLRPWVTVARDEESFVARDGDYWRGGIWLPTAYMGTKALEKYGFYDEANQAAEKLLAHMLRTYQAVEPKTIWECYSPSRDYPVVRKNGHIVRKDFCGWSALGPISMFIENVLGFHTADAKERRVEWQLHQEGKHGLRNFRFGNVVTDILYDGKGEVLVDSNLPYTLVINDEAHEIKSGNNRLPVRVVAQEKFGLRVDGGTGAGRYAKSDLVKIEAGAPPKGQVFYKWMGDHAGLVDDASASSTLFCMPEQEVVLTASYRRMHEITFVLSEHAQRVGGGKLQQSVLHDGAAVEPELRVNYGWSFKGWDKDFSKLRGDLVVNAILSEGENLLNYGGFEGGVKTPAQWNEFRAQSATLNLWYVPLFRDRFSLVNQSLEDGPHISAAALASDQCTVMYQAILAPAEGEYSFAFDYKNREGEDEHFNRISWGLWGYADTAGDDLLPYGNASQDVFQLQSSGQLIASSELTPGSCDWTTFHSKPVTVPKGLQRLVFGLGVTGIKASLNDSVAFDKVVFKTTGEK